MKHNRQRGGTLLGIVIGLVLGIGIALAVAVMITKTPIPFIDKTGRQQAADPAPGKVADPNRPLYGKRVTPPAELAPPANTAAPQPAAPPDVRISPPTSESPDREAPGTETPGGPAPIVEKSISATATVPAGEENWDYYLQAGAFSKLDDAESMRAKLALLGVEARITERQADTGLLFRVRAGPYAQQDAMNRVRTKLSDNGIDAAVVRISR